MKIGDTIQVRRSGRIIRSNMGDIRYTGGIDTIVIRTEDDLAKYRAIEESYETVSGNFTHFEPFPLDPPPDSRETGVYCHYETYPAGPVPDQGQNNQQLVIERVAGNGTVSRFECSRNEAAAILKFFLNTRCEVTV